MKPSTVLLRRSESGQFAVNMATNVALMGINMVIGIWFTPYLIRHLGVATYGIVILASTLTAYMAIFNSAVDNAVGRYLTLDLRIGSGDDANRTFNTALWTSILIALGLLPVMLLVSYAAPRLFDVPAGSEASVRWLFAAVTLTYLLVMVRSVYTASPFAHNRLDVRNLIVAVQAVGRVLLVVLLFGIVAVPSAWQVGAATFASAVGSMLLAIYYWRRLTPELTAARRWFDRARWRQLFGMSGWLVVNQVGSLLLLSVDLIIVNRILGAEVQGRYASVVQWSILFRTLAATVSTVLMPLLLQQFARQNFAQLAETTRTAVKLLGLLLALPIGVLLGFAEPLLTVWLGPEFADLALLLRVLTGHLCLTMAVQPLFSLQVALNRVRWPGYVTLCMGVVNVILAVQWARWGSNGLGVAVAGMLALTIRSGIYTPIYSARIQNLRWFTYLQAALPALAGTALLGALCYGVAAWVDLSSWFRLVAAAAAVAAGYAVFVYVVVLQPGERQTLLTVMQLGERGEPGAHDQPPYV